MMRKLLFVTCVLSLCLTSLQVKAQLSVGDIVIIGMSADVSGDEFSWVSLMNLTAGEEIYFSNASYNTNDARFCGSGTTDFLMKYTVSAGGLAAGTVQTVTGTPGGNYTFHTGTNFGDKTSLVLAGFGDPLIVFQSTDAIGAAFGNTDFTAIFAVTKRTTDWTTYTGNCTNASHNLHPNLTNGTNAIAAGAGAGTGDEYDNIKYTGITSGDKATILAAVTTLANWTGDNSSSTSGYTNNGVSNFTITVLPVELISFDAALENNRVALKWQTASEKNNEGFEVQRSNDGRNWENIGFVQGRGTTQEVQNYTYTDEVPLAGTNYYRLKQVDFDGAFEYSDVVNINYELGVKNDELEVFPNPVQDELNIVNGEGIATIYNVLGQPVKELIINLCLLKRS